MKKTLLTILITTSMATIYAEGNHSGGHGAGAHWMAPQADAAKPNPVKSDAASVDRGKKLYFQNCASCHGAKAMGDGPAAVALNPKPANLVAMSGGHPDGDFAWKIANGRGAMPGWKSTLKEKQIWELVNYIQSLNPNGKEMDMSKMDHGKMDMAGMDHSKMNMDQMKTMMAKMMPNMDSSKMTMDDMQNMMAKMKGKMAANTGHSNSDGHDEKPKADSHSHETSHSH